MIMIGILAKNWSGWDLSPAQFLENLDLEGFFFSKSITINGIM